ncbi:kinase-like protein, partial [Aspergillus sclerotioniger CBS 115572]
VISCHGYYPPGVSKVIGRGGWCYIGLIDDSTVLKYPKIPGEGDNIKVEAQILNILGYHPRIIKSHGLTDHGLVLQYALKGNLDEYITHNPDVSVEQRPHWCKQTAEAVSYIHEKNVMHCDMGPRNLLLDDDLDILLADFQGVLKSADGRILLDGLSWEYPKYYCPRAHCDYIDVKTDVFALGFVIYSIIMGHEVFPELNSWEHDEEIEARFANGQFPTDRHPCFEITEKCWKQLYESAGDVVADLSQIQLSD